MKLRVRLAMGLLFFYFVFLPFLSNAPDPSEKGLPFITNYLPKNYKALPQTWCVMEDNQGIMYFEIQNLQYSFQMENWLNKLIAIV